jgi:hypothetical protein
MHAPTLEATASCEPIAIGLYSLQSSLNRKTGMRRPIVGRWRSAEVLMPNGFVDHPVEGLDRFLRGLLAAPPQVTDRSQYPWKRRREVPSLQRTTRNPTQTTFLRAQASTSGDNNAAFVI